MDVRARMVQIIKPTYRSFSSAWRQKVHLATKIIRRHFRSEVHVATVLAKDFMVAVEIRGVLKDCERIARVL